MADETFCTVCKSDFNSDTETKARHSRWSFTSERTSVSQVQLLFKLFDILKQEFLAGSVCDECFSLVDQIDSLEFQIQAMTKALRSRIDLATIDDVDSLNGRDSVKRIPKRLPGPNLRNYNEEDEWESDIANDDNEEDATYKPASKLGYAKQPRLKRSKVSMFPDVESKRARFSDPVSAPNLDEDNSVDDDPIDVNKFLANDGVRIKEERSYDDIKYEDYPLVDGHLQIGDKDDNPEDKNFWDMLADPRVMDKALDTENVDYNVTMAQTTRGQEQLVYEGFTYKKYSYQDKQERVVKWKCSNYYAKKGKCPAKIATTPDGCCVLLDSKMDHNHEPDQSAIKIIMFRDRVKEMAVNHPDMKASEILANVEMLMDNPGPLGLKDESLMRYVQRVRSKQAKGEMGFKKVTYNRKKGYRWGMGASHSGSMNSESSPEKKNNLSGSEQNDFGSGQDFQPCFLEHVRQDQERHLSLDHEDGHNSNQLPKETDRPNQFGLHDDGGHHTPENSVDSSAAFAS